MATKILLSVAPEKGEGYGSAAYLVAEDFDEVANKIMPVNPPSSTEGHRLNSMYTKADGSGRLMIHPNLIATVEENGEEL